MRFLQRIVIHALNDRGEDTGPYLWRLTILELRGWSLKLHYFYRGDDDRDLHDHPWSFVSLIVWGGYFEHRPHPAFSAPDDICQRRGATSVRRWHGPGSILWRPAPSPHRVELARGKRAVTLLLVWPRSRQWGFYTICGWVPWTRYAKAKAEGC